MSQLQRKHNYVAGTVARGRHVRADFDQLINYLNEGIEEDNIKNREIKERHLEDGAATDRVIGQRTINEDIVEGPANQGSLTALMSFIVKALKQLKGVSWLEPLADSITGILNRLGVAEGLLANSVLHKNEAQAGYLDNRYYTKQALEPFLSGGDTLIHEEVYTIVNADNGDGTFTYTDGVNQFIGVLDEDGYQVFDLRGGSYTIGTNRTQAIINDTLRRSVRSGGLKEPSEFSIAVYPEGNGAEITLLYYERIGVTEESNLFYGVNQPPETGRDIIWLKDVT